MAGNMYRNWWNLMKPYYTQAYKQLWVGIGIVGVVFYKLSYGGKKAIKSTPAH